MNLWSQYILFIRIFDENLQFTDAFGPHTTQLLHPQTRKFKDMRFNILLKIFLFVNLS